jgi:biopolymer transport protein TolR
MDTNQRESTRIRFVFIRVHSWLKLSAPTGVHTGMAMSSGKRAEINVTPLIDVLLVLLIIFMVIIPQKSTGLAANVPQPAPDSSSSPPTRDIVVNVGEHRTVTINTQAVPWEDLAQRLQQIFARRPDGVLFVTAARQADFEDVAAVIDTARGAGIAKVALMPSIK